MTITTNWVGRGDPTYPPEMHSDVFRMYKIGDIVWWFRIICKGKDKIYCVDEIKRNPTSTTKFNREDRF